MSAFFDGTGPSRKKVYMGGISKKSSRSERLKKARDERQAREKYRIETQAALRLQKLFRGYYCRSRVKISLRKEFDGRMNDLFKVSHLLKGAGKVFYMPLPVLCELLRMCNIFYTVTNTGDFERILKLSSFVLTSLSSSSAKYNYGSLVHVNDNVVIDYSWIVRTYTFLSNLVESLSYGLRLNTGVNTNGLINAKPKGGIKTNEWRNMQSILNLVDMATSPQSWEFLKDIYAENSGSNIQNSQLRKSFGSATELVLLHLVSSGGNIKKGDCGLLDLTLLLLKVAESNITNNDVGKEEEYYKALLFYQSKLAATILRAFRSSYRDIVSSSAVSNAFQQFTKKILMLPNLFMPALGSCLKITKKANNIVLRDLLIPVTHIPNAWRSCLHVLFRWLQHLPCDPTTRSKVLPFVFLNFIAISHSKHITAILSTKNEEILKIHVKVMFLLIHRIPHHVFVAPEEDENLANKLSHKGSLSPPKLTRSISDLTVDSEDEDCNEDQETSIFDQTSIVGNSGGLLDQYNRPSSSTDIKRILLRHRRKEISMDTRIFCNIFDRKYFFRLAAEIRKTFSAKHVLAIFDSLLPTVEEIEVYDSTPLSKRESKKLSGVAAVFLGNLCDAIFERSGIGSVQPLLSGIGQNMLNCLSLQNRCSLLPRFWYMLNTSFDVMEFARSGNVTSGDKTNGDIEFSEIGETDVERALTCFFIVYGHLLLALDDNDFHTREASSFITKIGTSAKFIEMLSSILYRLIWIEKPSTIDPSYYPSAKSRLILSAINLYNLLYDRNSRRKFADESLWQWKSLPVEMIIGLLNNPSASSQTDSKTFCASMLLHRIPQVMNFDQRVTIFATTLGQHVNENFVEPGHGISVKIRRSHLYEDAMRELNPLKADLKGRIQVSFVDQFGLDEAGIDGGGLFKEFMTSLCKRAFDPQYGIFKQTETGLLYPNPNSSLIAGNHLEHFAFLGRILGKAVFEGILVEPQFAPFFLNKVLGRTNYVDDLQSYDSKFYQNLVQLKALENVEDAGLTFSVTTDGSFGNHEIVDLIPNGQNILVTNQNVIQYVHLMAHFKLNIQIAQQSSAFLLGFRDLVPAEFIRMFNQKEMQMLIGGSQSSFSVDDMIKFTNYATGYHSSQPYIQAFWQVIGSFSDEEKALLLKFWTSCSRPPLQGFKHLHPALCIQKVNITCDDDRLPTASTCMNLLKLPFYSNADVMKRKLLLSIHSAKDGGFGLS